MAYQSVADIPRLLNAVRHVDGLVPKWFETELHAAIAKMPNVAAREARDPWELDYAEPVVTIYGLGGVHRYIVGLRTGLVYFSAFHASSTESINDAARIGFTIFE
jgi:hypothetical protein